MLAFGRWIPGACQERNLVVLGAPVGGEVAAEGGGEDGLAELVEEWGHGVQRLLRPPAPRKTGFQRVCDSALLKKGRYRDKHPRQSSLIHFREDCSTLIL